MDVPGGRDLVVVTCCCQLVLPDRPSWPRTRRGTSSQASGPLQRAQAGGTDQNHLVITTRPAENYLSVND